MHPKPCFNAPKFKKQNLKPQNSLGSTFVHSFQSNPVVCYDLNVLTHTWTHPHLVERRKAQQCSLSEELNELTKLSLSELHVLPSNPKQTNKQKEWDKL